MSLSSRLIAACGLLLAAGCDDTVVVQLRTGAQELDVSAESVALPATLRDDASSTIASIACGPMGMCPLLDTVAIPCESGICDPAPRTVVVPIGDVLDFDVLAADARSIVRQIEEIEVLEASYAIAENTMTIDVPEIEVSWAPEGAAGADPAMGAVLLGTIPPIPARGTDPGAAVLDPVGVQRLSDYLVGTSRRVRFFGRTRIDLAPGGPFPEGRVRASVDLIVRITGSVVR